MSDMAKRLVQARELAGLTSAAEAARVLDVPYGTYVGHENGSRGFDKDDARRYAMRYKVNLMWLLYGIGGPRDKSLDQRLLSLPPEKKKAVEDFIRFQESKPD